jgi:hypothetical protein
MHTFQHNDYAYYHHDNTKEKVKVRYTFEEKAYVAFVMGKRRTEQMCGNAE